MLHKYNRIGYRYTDYFKNATHPLSCELFTELASHTKYTENSEFLLYIPKLTHPEFQKMKMCQI